MLQSATIKMRKENKSINESLYFDYRFFDKKNEY